MKSIACLTFLALALSPTLFQVAAAKPSESMDRAFLVQSWREGMVAAFRLADLNHDGEISRTEVPQPRGADFFRTYDLDHNGRITVSEMRAPRFQGLWVAHLVSDAATYFTWLDANHDGQIDRKEIAKLSLYTTKGLMPEQERLRAHVLTKADSNGDLGLSRREFQRYLGRLFGMGIGWGRSEQAPADR